MQKEGFNTIGAILFIILSFITTPLGGLAIAYFVFRGKEDLKWQQAKKILIVESILLAVCCVLYFMLLNTTVLKTYESVSRY